MARGSSAAAILIAAFLTLMLAGAAQGVRSSSASRSSRTASDRSTGLASDTAATTALDTFPSSEVTSDAPPDSIAALPEGPIPSGTSVRVISRATAKAVPGGIAQFLVVVVNGGKDATIAGEPVGLSFRLPTGTTFVGITDTNNLKGLIGSPGSSGAPAGTTWICRPAATSASGETVACDYGVRSANGKIDFVPIAGESAVGALVRLSVSHDFKPAAQGTQIALDSTLSAPGNTATSDQSVSAATDVLAGAPTPDFLPNTNTTPAPLHASEMATYELDFLNVGSGPASSSAGGPSLRLTNVLPPTLVNGWRAAGAGWSCTGAQNASPTCSYSGNVATGALTSKLVVHYRVSSAGIAALNLPVGAPDTTSTWDIQIEGNGSGGASQPVAFPDLVAVAAPAGATLTIEATAVDGVNELLPGLTKSTIDLAVTNLGQEAATQGLVLEGLIPAGINVLGLHATGSASAWACTVTPLSAADQRFDCAPPAPVEVPAARTLHLALELEAAANAKPGTGVLHFTASSTDDLAGLKSETTSIPVVILAGNAGFPALTLLTATGTAAPAPSVDGAPAAIETGTPFVEQLDLRNAGGAAIAGGSTAELVQSFGEGVSVVSAAAPPGWSCASSGGGKPTLTCNVSIAAPLATAAVLVGPTVTVTASRATPPGTNWPATVRLTAPGAPKAQTLPVLVTVSARKVELLPDLTTNLVPTAGGVGRFTATVNNGGTAGTPNDVELGVHLPAGARFASIGAGGWRCETTASSARCTSLASLPAGQTLAPVPFAVNFPARTGSKPLLVTAHVSSATLGGGSPEAKITVTPRPPLHAVIKDPTNTAFMDDPLVSAGERLTASTITLQGDGSGGSGLGLTYTWHQLCTGSTTLAYCPAQTPAVTWVGQPAGTSTPATADVEFKLPTVTTKTSLVFRLTVTDGSATASSTVRVTDLPVLPSADGFSLTQPHPQAQKAAGPLTDHVGTPLPAEKLHGPGSTTTLSGAKAPTLTHGTLANLATTTPVATTPAATTTEPASTSTTSTSTTSTSTSPTTTTGTSIASLAPIFCNLVRDAASGQAFSASLPGGIDVSFSGISIGGSKSCSSDTTISFSDSSLKIGSAIDLSGLAGTVAKGGITITAGTFKGPEAWKSPTLTLRSGSELTIPFPGATASSTTPVELEGSLSGDGFAFVPLPSGWAGTTTLTFTRLADATSVSVDTVATGPKSDTSPSSDAPSIQAKGTVSTDGTFSLSADILRLVQLQGHTISLRGSVSRATPDGALAYAISGSLDQPFDIVKGLSVKTLKVAIAPTDTSLGLTGEGAIEMTTPKGSLGVNVKLAYDNPKNWTLTAAGTGTASWTPLPGLTIAPSDVTGAITAKDDAYTFGITIAPKTTWKPTSSVSVSNLKFSLGNTCADTGAPCPTSASLYAQLSGDATFTLGSTVSTATVAGVLALPSGEFSAVAKLTKSLSIGAGISIDTAKIALSSGLPVPAGVGTPVAEAVDKGGLDVAIEGSATLPVLGKISGIQAAYSTKGWSIAAPLGSYSLPSGSGSGTKLGDTIVGWASYATSLKVTDPITKAVSSITLPANTFEVSGSFATPSWLKSMLKLPADVNGRATGAINLSTGDYALKMEFALSGNTYIYGSATSATSLKLTKTYFSIEKRAADFSIALGGEAALSTGSSSDGSLKSSSVTLGVALGFSTTTQTVTGSLTLTSKTGWIDALGAKDLTLNDLALTFQLNLSTLTPGLGLGATAILPGSIRSPLGMPATTRTTLVANFSVTNPCFGIDVSNPAGVSGNVLDLSNGAVTAKQFQLEIAPSGCTVGQFHYDPGLSINFDGAIAGLKVAVAAHLGFSPFAFDGKIAIGEFTVGGLNVQKTTLELSYSANKFRVAFAGSAKVLGATVELAGAVEQSGAVTKIDFKGKVSQITLGSVVSFKDLEVTAHVETGPKPALSFTAKGSAIILGSTVNANVALSSKDGVLTDVKADIAAAIAVGGSSGLKLDGTFHLDYGANRPLALTAAVKASIGTYSLGDGTVSVNQGTFTFTANFSIGSVFTARLSGAVYGGTVPAGTKILGPNGTDVNATTGDFVLTAKDVTVDLGGFKALGTVQLGRSGGTAWGNVATKIQLVGSTGDNSIAVKGSFTGSGDFTFDGRGNMSLIGQTVNVAVAVKKVGTAMTVHADGTLNILGSSVAASGDFFYNRGSPLFRLKGTGKLSLGGYTVANAAIAYSNFPEDPGFYAEVKVQAGSVASIAGRITIAGNGLYYLNANAALDLHVLRVNGNVTLTNCNFSGARPTCVSALRGTKLDASANFSTAGFSFGVSMTVQPDGSFSATARSPVSGEFTGKTGELSLLAFAFYADFKYQMAVTVSNRSPYVAVSGSGEANVYGKSWGYRRFLSFGWGGWSHLVGVRASFQTNPFKACGSISVWGVSFSRCI